MRTTDSCWQWSTIGNVAPAASPARAGSASSLPATSSVPAVSAGTISAIELRTTEWLQQPTAVGYWQWALDCRDHLWSHWLSVLARNLGPYRNHSWNHRANSKGTTRASGDSCVGPRLVYWDAPWCPGVGLGPRFKPRTDHLARECLVDHRRVSHKNAHTRIRSETRGRDLRRRTARSHSGSTDGTKLEPG